MADPLWGSDWKVAEDQAKLRAAAVGLPWPDAQHAVCSHVHGKMLADVVHWADPKVTAPIMAKAYEASELSIECSLPMETAR